MGTANHASAGWCRCRNQRSSTTCRTKAGAESRRRPTAAPKPSGTALRAPSRRIRDRTARSGDQRTAPVARPNSRRRLEAPRPRAINPDSIAGRIPSPLCGIGQRGRVADQHHAGVRSRGGAASRTRHTRGPRQRGDASRGMRAGRAEERDEFAVAAGSDRRSRRPRPTLRYSPLRKHQPYPLKIAAEVQLRRFGPIATTPAAVGSTRNSASCATTTGARSCHAEPLTIRATGQK